LRYASFLTIKKKTFVDRKKIEVIAGYGHNKTEEATSPQKFARW
jgi:hypothetical protein